MLVNMAPEISPVLQNKERFFWGGGNKKVGYGFNGGY